MSQQYDLDTWILFYQVFYLQSFLIVFFCAFYKIVFWFFHRIWCFSMNNYGYYGAIVFCQVILYSDVTYSSLVNISIESTAALTHPVRQITARQKFVITNYDQLNYKFDVDKIHFLFNNVSLSVQFSLLHCKPWNDTWDTWTNITYLHIYNIIVEIVNGVKTILLVFESNVHNSHNFTNLLVLTKKNSIGKTWRNQVVLLQKETKLIQY